MKVLFDTKCFDLQKFGGVSRYFSEMMLNLDSEIERKFPILLSNNESLQELKISQVMRFFPSARNSFRVVGSVNKLFTTRALLKQDFDVFYPTYYDVDFFNRIGNKPFVVTVHDMIHELYSHLFSSDDPTSSYKRLMCEKAAKIIVVSNNTKMDLIRLFGVPSDKIEVIYPGQSMKPVSKYVLNLPEKYILFTGARWAYKNFNRFLEAFSFLDESYQLVCTGSPFSDNELQLIKSLHLESRIRVFFATYTELSELYSRAKLFVFPSEYEGFGIPTIEAFSLGCPVALSNTSCFPEVAGDAGAYFDPLNVKSIYEVMSEVLENESLQQQMINNGYKQLEKFSWQKMGVEVSSVLKNVCNGGY